MRGLNYNHLFYFWTVAREGTIARAGEVLHLTPQTISAQLRLLEESVGAALFTRVGRTLRLTDTGRLVFDYAEEMFRLGAEMTDVLEGRVSGRPLSFAVGIVDVVPKNIAYRLLEPALARAKASDALTAEVIATYPGLALDDAHPLAGLVSKLTGRAPRAAVSYGSEAGLFQAAGIPSVVCGPGDIDRAHKPEEYITLQELNEARDMMLRLGQYVIGDRTVH